MTRWWFRFLAFVAVCMTAAMPYVLSNGTDFRPNPGEQTVRTGPTLTHVNQIQVFERAIDSNSDGRLDTREYYESGVLVRRESDRNFDDAIDLIEDFDVVTHQLERSVADTDFDGVADWLVLFQDGRRVFSEEAAQPSRRTAKSAAVGFHVGTRDGLKSLIVPFDSETTLRSRLLLPAPGSQLWTVPATFLCEAVSCLTAPERAGPYLGAARSLALDSRTRLRPSRAPPAA